MNLFNICLSMTANSTELFSDLSLEQLYSGVFKKLISLIYSKPECKMAFSFTGPQLEWFEEKHPEFLQLLKELVAKKQVELMGGGYYNPPFPLLFPIDRTGQIESLTAEIRRLTGKKPRGLSLFPSIWDNSLISSFQNCGMEWIQLNYTLIPNEKFNFLPLIINEQGKMIKVLPSCSNLLPKQDVSPDEYINQLIKQLETNEQKNNFEEDVECGFALEFTPSKLEKLIKTGWLKSFLECLNNYTDKIKLSLPTEYISGAREFTPAYIPSGITDDIAFWSVPSHKNSKNCLEKGRTINNFLFSYKTIKSLYDRMMYVSVLISNCHGDKARKNLARNALWKAQNLLGFVCSSEGVFAGYTVRHNAFKELIEAEKLIREAQEFTESITCYDYNSDGYNEFVCSMEKYTACITPAGAQMFELNIMSSKVNYADNLSKIKEFDGQNDNYSRGLFAEHLFTPEDFLCYSEREGDAENNLTNAEGVFSSKIFRDTSFSNKKNEIKFSGTGHFSNLLIPVTLRKKFIFNSNGFTVQYILKNEGPISLKGFFTVENNFAQTNFCENTDSSYKVDLISSGNSMSWNTFETIRLNDAVSFAQITDIKNNISFVFEPNESAGILCRTVNFLRPSLNGTQKVFSTSFAASLFWEIDLPGGFEVEKTINCTIIPAKKRK